MIPITSVHTGLPAGPVEKAAGPVPVLRPQEGEKNPSQEPRMDRYEPGEEQEPSGLYRLGVDQEGQPKVFFDSPQQPQAPEPEEGPAPGTPAKQSPARKKERCVADTGKVDRELERLRGRQEELSQRLNQETDPARREELERQLSQAERELAEKDNDTYRRQHTEFTQLD